MEMYRDMAVFKVITYNWFKTVLAGAVLGLFPAAVAVAQSTGDDPLPIPRNRPSVESYSLPPGPNNTPERNILQGPVDAEIPVARPSVTPPRESPATTPSPVRIPQSGGAVTAPAATNARRVVAPEQVKPVPARPEAEQNDSAPTTDAVAVTPPDPAESAAPASERVESTEGSVERNLPAQETRAEAPPTSSTADWLLLLFGTLLVILMGALFFWRSRRDTPKQPIIIEPSAVKASLPGRVEKLPEPPPVPAITIGFQPRSANATLINAVLSFELTLTNHGSEGLTGIRVKGAMVQAEGHGTGNPVSSDLSPLQEVPNLQSGAQQTVIAEFRIPLAGIRPIVFRSQALFVPLVQIAIEFTDGAGFQHLQTATYLVGQEHRPQRPKMAPFRLDLGPRSFTPLGHRPLAAS